ncbi:hypothetical protein Ddye_024556 [Dipteronia dyeriana]|uniref:HAT C-terminal dimerisation domain-containing protein n=1 Tax=Dipteronia dyeriana TaxID=168575 RepID=A0AAD9TVP1_9ROSI|nr:hypothetical protein Ddye_024556 [Dipteronia dyeriana]
MVVTAHFIDYDWQLQKRILSFSQIVDHKGDSIKKCIENVLLEWGIDKFFTITVDNATANTTAIGYVIRKLNSWQDDGVVLGDNDGLKNLHDSIVAIRNTMKYVKSSPSRLDRFKKTVAHEKIGTKGLVVLDVPTRWNSTYLTLESAVKLRKAFERMGEEDLHYVNYFREDDQNEQKRIGPPNVDDWDNAKVREIDDVFSFGVSSGPSDDLEFGRLKATDKEDSLWGMKQQEEDINKGKSEVNLYLLECAEKLNERFNVLAWWKNSLVKFPILSLIAREVFAIPVSTMASESAFSTGSRILDPFTSSLTHKSMKVE